MQKKNKKQVNFTRFQNWPRVNFEGESVFLFERNTWDDDDSDEEEEDSSSADSDQEEKVRSRRLPARR